MIRSIVTMRGIQHHYDDEATAGYCVYRPVLCGERINLQKCRTTYTAKTTCARCEAKRKQLEGGEKS